MSGTFKQQSEAAQEAAYEERKKMRIRDADGHVYGIGMDAADPFTGQTAKIIEMSRVSDEDARAMLVSLEGGTNLMVVAIAWRMLDYDIGDTT